MACLDNHSSEPVLYNMLYFREWEDMPLFCTLLQADFTSPDQQIFSRSNCSHRKLDVQAQRKISEIAFLTSFLFPLDPSATLLTIVDAEENAFVSTHIKENDLITKNVWLGLAQGSKGKKWQLCISMSISWGK